MADHKMQPFRWHDVRRNIVSYDDVSVPWEYSESYVHVTVKDPYLDMTVHPPWQ